MSFDIDQTLKSMTQAMADVLTGEWTKVRACAERALQDEKQALADIAQARIAGEIDDDEMKSQLADEEEALTASLLVCKIKARMAAQTAANAAIAILAQATKAAMRVV